MAIDPFGFLFVTGTFEETADFNPGNTTTNLISNGLTDLFLIKLNFSGGLLLPNPLAELVMMDLWISKLTHSATCF